MAKKDIMNTVPTIAPKVAMRLSQKVAPLEKQKRILSEKQWKFVQELVAGDGEVTMREAAIRAGFNPNSAGAQATDMTNPAKHPQVVAAIQQYRAQLALKYGTTFERHMRDLQKIRDAALQAGAYGAAVQAEYRRGQALGTVYVERKEIRHGTIDSMSREEVERKLAELKALYGGPPPKQIIDMEPHQVGEMETDPPFEQGQALETMKALEDVLPVQDEDTALESLDGRP
jgi:phage terminase small subunit